jgi:hypothetical protein
VFINSLIFQFEEVAPTPAIHLLHFIVFESSDPFALRTDHLQPWISWLRIGNLMIRRRFGVSWLFRSISSRRLLLVLGLHFSHFGLCWRILLELQSWRIVVRRFLILRLLWRSVYVFWHFVGAHGTHRILRIHILMLGHILLSIVHGLLGQSLLVLLFYRYNKPYDCLSPFPSNSLTC